MRQPQAAQVGRILKKSPHEIAVSVAHVQIQYGTILENNEPLLRMIKKAIFQTVRDTIVAYSDNPQKQ